MLAMKTDVGTPSGDLKPSQELLETIATAKKYAINAIGLVKKAYDLAIRDGFEPKQARQFLMTELPFISERTIRKALPDEAKDQSKVRTPFAATLPQNTINITTPHKVIDQSDDEIEDLIQKPVPVKDSTEFYKEQSEIEKIGEIRRAEEKRKVDQVYGEEEPTELELLKIENEQLKDALHKTQMFKPATDVNLQLSDPKNLIEKAVLNDDSVFEYLRKRSRETGDIILIDRVGAGALVQALSQYKTSFGVAELFLRVIKK